jgi:glutamate dehydrogenase (NADP+)
MTQIHASCYETADDYGAPGNYVLGANIRGFIRVADAMAAFGVI